ncbi:Uma2 family endonuclease [Roseofilum sp. BLCC_M91]|uniref:Uma2 family endonuclease n=1 Tax=Roseofilum halophilum BLCC-M91 TaxID=3022259 RepID=A0ABT7BJR9_9CYAN|nr:Uma2 family endonuclease [Roseofilum halophilum]MDJ1179429.1 Uma2 family endonuclease [Roseofilum halophilum BLCC-M91]
MTPTQATLYTPEAYLDLEINSQERHEYRSGEIIPMTGGTPNHNELMSILNAFLRVALRGQSYGIFIADQRLWIPEFKIYTYPDVMVISRPVQLQEGRKDTVTNPLMIAEVLSKSTKNYDKDEKFAAYRSIPSFQEYLLIDQSQFKVEHYYKAQVNQWIFSEYKSREDSVNLSSLPCEIPLADLYDDLQL